ncbi:hypothetical protein Poli38472_010254 [Pythium oligandrum]|uniref:C2 domain-containing protein n=1 Tax=Pythium oligandrum TaxID=41045 RepID=A0A8K1FCT8_PYTOL|nr:hypothetical protein Poli38472_010254 [Pythium oligandrum]|eukprot:TMW58695.1 hypothetical protein Poli38472_010254 [Pythium oligandrum]
MFVLGRHLAPSNGAERLRRNERIFMELRQRVRAFGRSKSEDPQIISFWLCEGLKKRHVRGAKNESLSNLLRDWEMTETAENQELYFLNESTGMVVPRNDEIGRYVNEKDVVRMCESDEIEKLLEKFATRDADAAAEMSGNKNHTPLGAAISKLKRIGATNPTIKMIQKSFEDRQHHDEEAELLERFPEIDPVFESGEVEVVPDGDPRKCDVCDVSWPDEAGAHMFQHKRLNAVTHQGCAQFASDVLAHHPEITTREALIGSSNLSLLNRPGTFHVTVHRAMDLPGAQLLGTQAPYAKLSLLPWKEPIQTKPVENGGRNPLWKSMHDNMMTFSHMYNSSITPIPLLEVEIWNSNYLSDDLIACTLLDMTPLLRYPNVEIKRWFTLSSRVQAPIMLIQGHNSGQPRVLISIKFVPHEGKLAAGNDHKFRVHHLKSVGLAIPMCAVCDRVIVNVLKNVWGYRCEHCKIDVHKGCIMKAMTKCECKRSRSNSVDSVSDSSTQDDEKPVPTVVHRGLSYKLLNDEVTNEVGKLYVKFDGLHLCTKQCHAETNLHARNIFEGDTYCRLTIDNTVYETSPVLKSADPMYMEQVCFNVRRRNAVFKIEVIDFTNDTCIAEVKSTLFELLQKDSDDFIHTNALLEKIRTPLKRLNLEEARNSDITEELATLREEHRYGLSPPLEKKSTNGKKIGFALVQLGYFESKRDLFRSHLDEELHIQNNEDKDVSVESLKVTIDRFGRAIKTFQWVDAEYTDIIAWKNKKKSTVCFVLFVASCIWVDLEYAGAYILSGVAVYMLYQLRRRLEGEFEKRWIGYMDYDQAQTDRLKLHRPIAELFVAVNEAKLTETTDRLLKESQAELREIATTKPTYYVRIKYLPNDKQRSNDTLFIPSPYSEAIVGWTHPVDKSRNPVWRNPPPVTTSDGESSHPLAPPVQKQKKDYPFRNFQVSWRHNADICDCDRCAAWRNKQENSDEAVTCGIDHHALFFPIPQACRKNFSRRDDVVPWKLFPGLLQFDLCVSVTGSARSVPDLIVATGSVQLRDVRTKPGSTQEIAVTLTRKFTPGTSSVPVAPVLDDNFSDGNALVEPEIDQLFIRVELSTPDAATTMERERSRSVENLSHQEELKKKKIITPAERSHAEFVCESMIEKEKSAVIGQHLFDALSKVKDTIKTLQNEIDEACGTLARVENLFNWTHPWKSAVVFSCVILGAIVLSFIKGRWMILLFGLTEFGAVFLEDLPPSDQLRHIVWNLLVSLPTDQHLIEVYGAEREIYLRNKRGENEKNAKHTELLRHHGLWAGTLMTKGDSERSYKLCYAVYRPYRFVLWKSAEDAESGVPPFHQLLFERTESIVHGHKIDEKSFVFHVFGTTVSGVDEKRSFSFDSEAKMEDLLRVIRRSCAIGSTA